MIGTAPGQDARFRLQILTIGAFWVVSDLGYYFLLPALGRSIDYTADPVAISLFYAYWIGAAGIQFWPVYLTWGRHARWRTLANPLLAQGLWAAVFAGCLAVVMLGLPQVPPADWPAAWGVEPDLVRANGAYFLPKSMEIVFQQLLVLALVLVLAGGGMTLGRISALCAALFGGMHALLVFGPLPMMAVLRFMVFSSLFGLVLPWLFLRLRSGMIAAFLLHWSYYALTVLALRLFGPGAMYLWLTGG